MIITEAIEILTQANHERSPVHLLDLKDAVNLGIEALKRLKDIRHFGEFGAVHPLPGETQN